MIVLSVLLLAGSAQAGVYKCQDAAGKMHYQDRICGAGKKAAGWNQSAGNMTTTDSAASSAQARAFIAQGEAARERLVDRSRYQSDDTLAYAQAQTERTRLQDEINKTAGSTLKSQSSWQRNTEARRVELDRRLANVNAREAARINGQVYIPERAPTVVKNYNFHSHENPGHTGPFFDARTGRFCNQTGGNTISCN